MVQREHSLESVTLMASLNGKNILVTGACGFLGAWLSKELVKQGATVTALDLEFNSMSNFRLLRLEKKTNIVVGSIAKYDLVERALNRYDIDTCFHLGAQAIVPVANRAPIETFKSNIEGTWNLLEASRKLGTVERIIVASSDKAYGEHETLPYTENAPLKGMHPYDVSKSCTDLISQTYFHTYGLPVSIARCGNIYGGGDAHFSRIVPGTIKSALSGQQPIIRSDGTPVRDYIYVDDVVEGYITIAEKMKNKDVVGQAFNFGTNKPLSVKEIVLKILNTCGKQDLKPKILAKSSGEIKKQYLSSDKAKKVLGWSQKTSIDAGLKPTVKWYSKFFAKK